MSTQVQVYFVLKGSFDPASITNMLKLAPTEEWREGDKGKSGIRKKYDSWIVGTGYIKTLDSSELIKKVFDMLHPSKDLLAKAINDFDLIANFMVVAKVENKETPSIDFERDLLKFAGEINASLEVDLHIV